MKRSLSVAALAFTAATLCAFTLGVSTATAQSEAAATPDSSCARSCLRKFVDGYVASMLKQDAASVPVSADVKITQNAVPIHLGEGVWKTARKFFSTPSSTQYVADPETGQIARMGIIDDNGKPAFYAVRVKISNDRITEIETLLSHDGDAMAFQPEGYLWREAPYVREMPLQIRSSRQGLLKIANTYWTIATTTHKGADVPYSDDCIHVENGMNTDWERPLSKEEASKPEENPQSMFDGRIWTCAREVNLTSRSYSDVRGLRFIVDEERGLVMAWNLVDVAPRGGPGGPPPGGAAPRGAGGAPGAMPGAMPFEYGPPSRGPDGWPAQGGMGGPRPGGLAAGPHVIYNAAVMRIARGKINREQVFQTYLPRGTAAPF